MAEDGDRSDFVDDVNEEENENQNLVTDTTSAEARRGKDIQGIPWNRLNVTREQHRRARLKHYRNYANIQYTVDNRYKQMPKGGYYYDFCHNSRAVRPTILHHELRNLVWATTKHDVYLLFNHSIVHWSLLSKKLTETVNFFGHVAPTEKHLGSLLEGFARTLISTFAVDDGILVAGGFRGELVCKRLDRQGVCFCTRTSYEGINAITNGIEIYNSLSGGKHFMASNNACVVMEYEMNGFQLVNDFRFPWIVNHTSLSPDGKLLAVVGDHRDALLVDSTSGLTVGMVKGHRDYSFASAWHPDGRSFATGSQDKTCRVWDVRNLTKPVTVLKGNMAAIRSLRFSTDGQFLAVAEAADFVNIYNTSLNYQKRHEIDLFGEIAGVSFSPDDETLFIGVSDQNYPSLLQFNKRHKYGYLDSFV